MPNLANVSLQEGIRIESKEGNNAEIGRFTAFRESNNLTEENRKIIELLRGSWVWQEWIKPSRPTYSYAAFTKPMPAYSSLYDLWNLPHRLVISVLPDACYTLLRPIPVRLKPDEYGGWTASFYEANISMPGSDPEDARQMLADDIAETFALFLAEEETLGPGPKRQLAVLKQYLQVG